jgi:hypothetical protein
MTVTFGGSAGGYFTLHADVTETAVNTGANTSTVHCHVYITCSNSGTGVYDLSGAASWSATVSGNTQSGHFTYDERGNTNTIDLGSFDTTVAHNSDGTGSAGYSASANMDNSPYVTTASGGGTLTLTTIARYAVIDGGPNINDCTDEWIEFAWHADRSCDYYTWWSTAYDGGGHHDTPTSGQGWWIIDLHNLKSNTQYDITVGIRNAASGLWTFSSTVYTTTKSQNNFIRGRTL